MNLGKLIAAGSLLLVVTGGGEAAADSATPSPTTEQRESMAKMHEAMAACMRSEKAMTECRSEMHKDCAAMGRDMCGMMGGRDGGAMRHKGMGKSKAHPY